MLMMQVSSQTDNHMYKKSVAAKIGIIFLKNGSGVTFLYKMPTLWNSEVNKVILEQVKVTVGL